jgi:hypothetical protein
MRTIALPLLVAGFVLAGTSAPHAQSPDPSGHWEGTITSPTGQTSSFAVDLVRDDRGELAGTIDLPGDGHDVANRRRPCLPRSVERAS